jgi:hypothetical protein
MTDSDRQGTFDHLIADRDPAIAAFVSALKTRIAAMHRDHAEIDWPLMRIAT